MSSRPGSMRNSGRSRQGQCHLRFHRLLDSQIGQDKVSIILDSIDYQVHRSSRQDQCHLGFHSLLGSQIVKTRLVSSWIPQITRFIDRPRQGQRHLRFHRLLGLQIGQDKVIVIPVYATSIMQYAQMSLPTAIMFMYLYSRVCRRGP